MKKVALLSAIAALGLGTAANAAVLHVTAQITQMTNANSTAGLSSVASTIDAARQTSAPHDYKITYFIHVDGLTGQEQGFGNLAANFTVPVGSLTRSTVGAHINYSPSNASANEFGNPGSLIFSIDGDQGTSTSDLQGIAVSVPAGIVNTDGTADDGTRNYRLAAINDGAVPIGSVWVSYNGGAQTTVVPDFYQWSVSLGSPGVLTNVGNVGIDQSGASVTIGAAAVPEPASLSLLALGGLGLAARRRRA